MLANIYVRSADTWHSESLGGQRWRSAWLQIVPNRLVPDCSVLLGLKDVKGKNYTCLENFCLYSTVDRRGGFGSGLQTLDQDQIKRSLSSVMNTL